MRIIKCFKKIGIIVLLPISSYAATSLNPSNNHPFYFGAAAGIGSTTWNGLVPAQEKQNEALSISTPIEVQEGGAVFGAFVGYEMFNYLAIEASYMRYPSATVAFDEMSLFSFDNEGLLSFRTRTETVNLMGKVMVPIPKTSVKLFSSAGAALIHRQDILLNDKRLSPTFGLGLNYDLTPHIMGELGGNYTAGFGESDMNPTITYFPFLYSITIRLAYRV